MAKALKTLWFDGNMGLDTHLKHTKIDENLTWIRWQRSLEFTELLNYTTCIVYTVKGYLPLPNYC
jgi:hypothetical protein